MHWAAYIGHEGLVRLLVRLQAHIDQQDDQGFTPLHWAASKGNRTVARTLIELGASIDIKVRSKPRSSNYLGPREVLLTLVTPATLQDTSGNTAFDVALKKGHYRMVDTLQSHVEFVRANKTKSDVCSLPPIEPNARS